MLRTLFVSMLMLFIAASALVAQDNSKGKAKKTQTELVGFLADVQCGASFPDMKIAETHSRDCSMAEACAKSGYGVFSETKFIKFNQAGNEKAKAILKASTKEAAVKVKVKGTLNGDTFAVAAIEEVK